jgi:hypothetical protein
VGTIGYYGFLATRIAPGRLLGAAALRAARTALNRVAPPLPPGRDRLLASLGCDGAATLARLLARPRPCRAPWTPESLRAALDAWLPGEVERAIARSDDAAGGRLSVLGRTVDVSRPGGGTDWQLDPIHGGRFAAWAPSRALPPAPGLDAHLARAIGRGEQWVALAQGAVLAPGRRADLAAALSASVADFCAANPLGSGVQWTSASEAGLRAWNLVLALWLLAGGGAPLPPALALDAARLLVATGRFVLAHLEDDTAVPASALAADWLGLLACAEGLPEWPESPRWRALATEGLSGALRAQVHDDGATFEGALPYQRLACEVFAGATLLRLGARRGVDAGFTRRLAAAFRALRALLASDGTLPVIGDADAPRLLALRDRAPGDGRFLLSLGAALLRAPDLLPCEGPGDAAEVAWLLGPERLAALSRAAGGPRPRSASFPAAGLHVLRRGPFEVFVSCGPNGQRGVGGHSHNDKLAVEVRAGGAVAVCDGGSPSTGGDAELRDAFRSTRAHATVVVDGLEQSPLLRGRPAALPDVASARLLAFEPGGAADRILGEHRGFARAGVVHRRELHVGEAGIAVVDRLAGSGVHRVELRWPFARPGAALRAVAPGEATLLDRLARATRLRASVDAARAVDVPLGSGRVLLAFAVPEGLAVEVAPSVWSPAYGALADGSTALVSGPLRCPAALVTLLVLLPG